MVFNSSFTKHWQVVQSIFSIRTEAEYDAAIENLNQLIDIVGTDESHPLYSMLDTLGTVVHVYEEAHETLPETDGIDALTFLMQEHGLRQSDLPEIGSQGVVSEILNRKRVLNIRQIRKLSERFSVNPSVFV